jgi:hypothetical protein
MAINRSALAERPHNPLSGFIPTRDMGGRPWLAYCITYQINLTLMVNFTTITMGCILQFLLTYQFTSFLVDWIVT